MTNVKDKLSASVRQARTLQQPAGEDAAATATTAPTKKVAVTKPAAVAKPKAAPKPKPAAKPATAAVKPSSNIDVQPSGSTLFPSRVWPD